MSETTVLILSILVAFYLNGIFTASMNVRPVPKNVAQNGSDPPPPAPPELSKAAPIDQKIVYDPSVFSFNNFIPAESFPGFIPEEPLLLLAYENGLYPFVLDSLDTFILYSNIPPEIYLKK